MTKPVIGFWDTEWSPAVSYTWSNKPKFLVNEMLVEPARLLCFGVRKEGQKTTKVVDERIGRVEMLTELRDWLSDIDVLVSYNGQSFDTRKVNSEFMKVGLTPPAPYKEVDLFRVIRKNASFYSHKLGYVADEILGNTKVDTGGFDLWRRVLAGEEAAWRKFRTYQRKDVDLLVELFDNLRPWVKMPTPVGDPHENPTACHNCGNDHLQRRGWAYTLYGKYPRYQCAGDNGCGKWLRGQSRQSTTEIRPAL